MFAAYFQPTKNRFTFEVLDDSGADFVTTYETPTTLVIADSYLLKPTSCRNTTDAAVIVKAYEQHRCDCFATLRGPFTCVIWDKRQRAVIVAKDTMGQRSLFYSQDSNGDICLSNLMQPLLENERVTKQIDDSAVAKFLACILPDNENTLFQHIKKLPYGSYLKFTEQALLKPHRFWSPDAIAAEPLILPTSEDYYSAFRELYQTVIADHLQGKSRIATHLSGGLDSTSITNIAARQLSSQQNTVDAIAHTPKYPKRCRDKTNWNHDDRAFIEESARFNPNIKLHYTRTSQPLFHYIDHLHPLMEQPPLNPTNTLWLIEAAEIARQCEHHLLLTGQGGNSTISWPLVSRHKPAKPYQFLRVAPRTILNAYSRKRQNYRANAPWQISSAPNPELAVQTQLAKHYQYEQDKRQQRKQDKQIYYHWAFYDYMASMNTAMRYCYKVSQLDPTMDQRIIEFFLRTPEHIYDDQQGNSRLLIRKGLTGLMPNGVLNRTTRGQQGADWPYWLEAQKKDLTERLHAWKQTEIARYLDLPHLIQLMKKWDLNQATLCRGRKRQYFENQYPLKLLRAVEMGLYLERHLPKR